MGRRSGEPTLAALALVTGVSPFATDTYIAALPAVRGSLHTGAGSAQLTMTAFIVGLAAGQLVFGPVSDGHGRRRLMILSSASFAVVSAVCAVAPNAPVLIAARVLEGLAGGCGVAVGRAVISDRYSGLDAAARYGTLASITLLAPIVAPAVGALVLLAGDWRAVFVFLAALGGLMTLAAVVGIPETLPAALRPAHGLRGAAARMRDLLRERAFVGTVAVQCLATAGFFVYIGGSSFVLQEHLGLSRGQYSLLFVSNAAAMALTSACFRLTVRRLGPRLMRAVGVGASTTAALLLAGYAAVAGSDVRLAPTWVLLAVVVAGMGFSIPATTAIAQDVGRHAGGTASALQGGLTFAVGAAATPLTGLTGLTSVAGMAAMMACLFLASVGVLGVAGGVRRPARVSAPAAR